VALKKTYMDFTASVLPYKELSKGKEKRLNYSKYIVCLFIPRSQIVTFMVLLFSKQETVLNAYGTSQQYSFCSRQVVLYKPFISLP